MSERARIRSVAALALCGPLCALAPLAHAQGAPADTALAFWQAREAALRHEIAQTDSARLRAEGRLPDRIIRVEDVAIAYAAGTFSARDSAIVAAGIADGLTSLRARHGEVGVALARGARWAVRPATRFRSNLVVGYELDRSDSRVGNAWLPRVFDARDVARIIIGFAGERLTRQVPALASYNGYGVLQPDGRTDAEVARRLALSTSATTRRCWAGAIAACAVVMAPFDPGAPVDRYYAESEYRHVVRVAALPGIGDSVFFAHRRRCLDDSTGVALASCESAIRRLALPDPLNPMVRGSLLAHALRLGGRDALTRAGERQDLGAIGLLGHIAGVPEDSLLRSWRRSIGESLARERDPNEAALLLTSIAWGGLLLAATLRRRLL